MYSTFLMPVIYKTLVKEERIKHYKYVLKYEFWSQINIVWNPGSITYKFVTLRKLLILLEL
jgi:hypothetical protein